MAGRPVEIIFEFDKVRNFSAMHIHSNNMYSKDVQVKNPIELILLFFFCHDDDVKFFFPRDVINLNTNVKLFKLTFRGIKNNRKL